jgi:NADH:ubiquinone oxidoreductase subunit F (NADH-binding)
MPPAQRILDPEPVTSLDAYLRAGGGHGLDAARRLGPAATVDEVLAAGIRGRGGAGFPTGVKWRTVAANASDVEPTTVVVNAAEGEPGSFKDRALLERNPYRVLEGALIAALAVGACDVVVGMKRTATRQIARVRAAVDELEGTELGAAAFIVLDDATDLAAVAASVSRFLAVESCGQCTPCKQDGLMISDALERVVSARGTGEDLEVVRKCVDTVASALAARSRPSTSS